MEIGPSSPADLAARIRARETAAEDELVRRYSRGVRFVISQSVADRGQAEDVYQETFRLALEKIREGEVREPERLSGFLMGIARTLVLEHFRRAARAQVREQDFSGRQIPVAEPSPLDRLLRQEQAALVHRVLAALPSDRDRSVLYRFYVADEDKDAICDNLGISGLHFNQILCRARERYRKLFEQMRQEKGK